MNSTLLKDSVPEAVARLKTQPGGDLIVLGSGRRLFIDGGAFATLCLVDNKMTPTGVAVMTYVPAEPAA